MRNYALSAKGTHISKVRRAQLESSLTEEEFQTFQSRAGELGWLARQLRCDRVYENGVVQRAKGDACVGDLGRLKQYLAQAKRGADFRLRYWSDVNLREAVLILLADPGHASGTPERDEIMRYRSVGGYFVLVGNKEILEDKPARANVLTFYSGQTKRVCRSTLAAEASHLAEAVECGDWCACLLEEALTGDSNLKDWPSVIQRRVRVYVIVLNFVPPFQEEPAQATGDFLKRKLPPYLHFWPWRPKKGQQGLCQLLVAVLQGDSVQERLPRVLMVVQSQDTVSGLLSLLSSSPEGILQAASAVALISCNNTLRTRLIEVGALVALKQLLSHDDSAVVEQALEATAALVTLDRGDPKALEEGEPVFEPTVDMEEMLCGEVSLVVHQLQGATEEIRCAASHVVFKLAARGDIEMPLRAAEPLPALVSLIRGGTARTRAWAASALRLLSTTSEARETVTQAVPMEAEGREKLLAQIRALCF
ncbi:unnamed protein product [Durusdinium trenchii]|uniref:Uncharacterized protein n=1 Tax=Durusdinium trenchii TaxID=1381693 RepID=A0ABP0Q498_9DINO